MKAQKITVVVTMEALSIECFPGLITQVVNNMSSEFENGELTAQDGDTIRWSVTRESVEF